MTDELEKAWAELLLDACASDGPIRDNDVRDAIKRNRPRIEAAVLVDALREPDEHPHDFKRALCVHGDPCRERLCPEYGRWSR